MTKKLQITLVFVLFLLFALSNMAMAPLAQAFLSPTLTPVEIKQEVTATRTGRPSQTVTPSKTPRVNTPAPSRTKLSLDALRAMQAGNSDWIAFIGILIVAIIVIPLLLKYKEWREN